VAARSSDLPVRRPFAGLRTKTEPDPFEQFEPFVTCLPRRELLHLLALDSTASQAAK